MPTLSPPTLDEVRAANAGLEGVIVRTPLVPLHDFRKRSQVWLKAEIHQPINSFKLRGIYHAVSCLSETERAKGLSTVSAGNTAQALAWCGRHFGVPSRSLMPDSAPQTKIDAVRAYGGEPVLVPVREVFRFLQEQSWNQEPYSFIHPWINRHVMIGHGSMALEIVEACPEVETVFIPVGGGGLMAGVGSTLKALKPEVKIIAVEPDGCPALHASLHANRPMHVDCETCCDGVAVPYITDELFPLLRDLVDDCVLVPENAALDMVRQLALGNKMVVEPSGALAVAAVMQEETQTAGVRVAIVTGGSLDLEKLMRLLPGPGID